MQRQIRQPGPLPGIGYVELPRFGGPLNIVRRRCPDGSRAGWIVALVAGAKVLGTFILREPRSGVSWPLRLRDLEVVSSTREGISLTRNGITLIEVAAADLEGYGAWMHHAAFSVQSGRETFAVEGRDYRLSARYAIAGGDLTGSRPTAVSATWRGVMVGTPATGSTAGNILQGDAALTYTLASGRGMLDAAFTDINDKEGLPEPVRRNVEAFLERLRARKSVQIDFDLGLWRDDNVNGASEYDTVEIPVLSGLLFTLDQRPVRAWVARTGARLRWRKPLPAAEGTYFETNASAARNTALGRSEHNRTWASASIGPRVPYRVRIAGRRRHGLARADPGAERRWRGGNGYARGVWFGLGLDQTFSPDWQAGVLPRLWETRYDGGDDEADARGRSLGVYVSRRAGPGWFTVRAKASRERPERRTLRWRSRGAWVGSARGTARIRRDPRCREGDCSRRRRGAGYADRMDGRNVTRRKVLAVLAAGVGGAGAGTGALGALVSVASARVTPTGYTFPGPTPDRKLGLSPPLACTPGTRAQTAGPFYTPRTPRRWNLREPGTTGETLFLEGIVLTPDCRPVAGAVVDVWHCDEHGRYDNEGFRYRGHQFTDAAGAFRFETIRPTRYRGRTAHIHVRVQGEGTRLLTTQVYFPDLEAANRRDFIFRDDLVMRLGRAGDGEWRGRFDFVLAPA